MARGGGVQRGGGGSVTSATIPDPYVPPDGDWNVTGSITATGTITGAELNATSNLLNLAGRDALTRSSDTLIVGDHGNWTTLQVGNGTGGFTTVNVEPDADVTCKIGRALLDSRDTDVAYISHVDQTTAGGGNVRFETGGTVRVNAASGQTVDLAIAGTNHFRLVAADGFRAVDANGAAILNEAASSTNPTVVTDRADLTTGVGGLGATNALIVSSSIKFATTASQNVTYQALNADNSNGPALLNEAASLTNPTLLPDRSDATTGIGGDGSSLSVILGGSERVRFTGSTLLYPTSGTVRAGTALTVRAASGISFQPDDTTDFVMDANAFRADDANGGALLNEVSSSTNPTLIPDRADLTTGVGGTGGEVSLIRAGAERLTCSGSSVVAHAKIIANASTLDIGTAANPFGNLVLANIIYRGTTAGITASTTQTQGEGPLTTEVNEIATCATANDTVTLPTAAAGAQCVVINNGAETAQIFPASGDDLGAGVDTATTLASGSNVRFMAYDATNWEVV